MNTELFQDEQAVVDRATRLLDDGLGGEREARDAYASLLADYEQLLKQARDQIESRVQERTKALQAAQAEVERLIDVGIALSAERSSAALMEQILVEAKDLTNADGGTLYIRTDDDHLKFEIIRSDSLKLALGGASGGEIGFDPLPLYDPETGEANHNNVATHAALSGRAVNVPDAYDTEEFDFSGTKEFDQGTNYRSKSFLTVPMKTRAGEVIGVLQLLNARDRESGEVIAFPEEIEGYVESLSSQAAVALDNQNLIEAQKALLDSFIVVIAGAIDEKSPYTGGHCERVPELAMLLAQAACDSDQDPFKDFYLTEDGWYEFEIAGWLHDCGKVTTPEYVVDKATKLETIYNRIHEIRTRFEVLRRDAEIAYLRAMLAGDGDADGLARERDARYQALDDDFAFIAECNIGGEFMDEDKVARIRQLAETKWQRYFDDRLGLAHDELARMERTSAESLPAEEPLLADRHDHLIYRKDTDAPFGDNEHGFVLEVPEHEYNNGEIHNLCIQRGTLNDEERYKINHHIIQTIIMLGQLPFPKNMARVPEYAGGHHEKMDGKGYPRGIAKSEMSIPARIMAVADIFEALTAWDRPYKKAKTLSESIRIMSFMVKDQHIDPDIFRLFLQSGAYMRYAEKFLRPDQLDEVDIDQFLEAVA
ncbi:MAG: HD domain-containing phosphohydrolase [Alphaproteobacteria bacterium]|jgi:HD-GYP domain-containing protein (c-di-GMP phosphodiesterase class II)|nr:HD domain-containing phosphohydrolase [Alphaproteobacteria bacterium]